MPRGRALDRWGRLVGNRYDHARVNLLTLMLMWSRNFTSQRKLSRCTMRQYWHSVEGDPTRARTPQRPPSLQRLSESPGAVTPSFANNSTESHVGRTFEGNRLLER